MARIVTAGMVAALALLSPAVMAQEADTPVSQEDWIAQVTEGLEPGESDTIEGGSNISIAFENAHASELRKGFALLNNGEFAAAVDAFDRVITAYEADYGEMPVFCANDEEQAMAAAALALLTEREGSNDLTVLGPGWCTAIFAKGFALIDLHRPQEALPYLEQAVAMVPLEPHFLNELAEWHKSARNWDKSYELFEKARDLSQGGLADEVPEIVARSLRGMAYSLIEQRQFARAKELLLESKEFDPDNPAAQIELDFIASQEAKQEN